MPRTEAGREARRRYHKKLRRDVLAAYGDICGCCGETTRAFLSIDWATNARFGQLDNQTFGQPDNSPSFPLWLTSQPVNQFVDPTIGL